MIFGFAIEFWHWFALAAVLLLLEMLAPGIFFMFLAVGAAIVGAVLWVVSDVSLLWQAAIFVVTSFFATYIGRRLMVRAEQAEAGADQLNRRGSELVGKIAILSEPIVGGRGRARLGDTTWIVVGPDAPLGASVEVIGSSGTELKVRLRG